MNGQKTQLDGRYLIKNRLMKQLSITKMYRCYDKQDQTHRHIKQVNIDYIFQHFSRQQRKKFNSKEETFNLIMKECNSPYVCRLYHSITNDKTSLYILDDLEDESLEQQLKKKCRFSDMEAIIILQQLVLGLESISFQNIICKYLNLRSVRFIEGVYKIGRYEASPNEDSQQIVKICIAPQILYEQPYNEKVDIYSLGVILFMMVDKSLTIHEKMLKFRKMHEMGLKSFNSQLQCLILNMTFKDPQTRIPLTNIKQRISKIKEIIFKDAIHSLPQRLLLLPSPKVKTLVLSQKIKYQNHLISEFPMKKAVSSEIQQISDLPTQYDELNEDLFQVHKIQFIYSQYLQNIEKIQKKKKLPTIQFLFLINTRLLTDLVSIDSKLKEQDPLQQSLKIFIIPIQSKVQKKFQQLSRELTKQQDKGTQIVKRRFKLIGDFFSQKKEVKQKQKFLAGIEKLDYSKKEQIDFTVNFLKEDNLYKELFLPEMHRLIENYDKIIWLRKDQLKGMKLRDFVVTHYC